jgi:L-alanine-DL-glutamate epimerase-like enolase superfamily enzyme
MTDLAKLTITGVRAAEVRNVPFSVGFRPPWSPAQSITTRDYIVVRVETNAGVFGLSMDGEYTPYGIPATAEQIEQLVTPYLVGRRVADMEAHSAFLHSIGHLGRFFFVEVALWDIMGKAVGLPLYQLWGGKRDKVRVYASTVHHGRTPEERAQDCLAYLARGYRAVKLRLSASKLADNLKLVERCRAAVGDRMAIMVDANQAGRDPALDEAGTWDLEVAREAAYHLADLAVAWLEEPLPYEMEEAGAQLRRESTVAIAGGECGVGLRPFGVFIEKGIYDILQPDPITSGTPTDMLKIMAMAEGAGVLAVFHHGKSGVGFLVGLHLCTAFGDAPWLEYMDDGRYYQPEGFQAGFSQPYPIDAEGYAHCPQEPGLGGDWDFDWLQAIGLA